MTMALSWPLNQASTSLCRSYSHSSVVDTAGPVVVVDDVSHVNIFIACDVKTKSSVIAYVCNSYPRRANREPR